MPWREWVAHFFPHVTVHPFAERHVRLWEWFENLVPGVQPPSHIEIWGRGGAKSSSAELGCARVGAKLSRRFCLYVSGAQEQADAHVQSIADLFEILGVDRLLNKYGTSKGWKRNQLRTANGFNVVALGLDSAARGIKLGQFRPDLIILDDIDSEDDSIRTVDKKIRSITTKILPAGSSDCAVLGVQNLIHEDSIFAQIHDGKADFLRDAEVSQIEPAVIGLKYEGYDRGDGRMVYRVTGGEPTWAGQDLAVCEYQINKHGLTAFLRESQHEVKGADGYVFATSQMRRITIEELPPFVSIAFAWDLAATEGGGDHTVGVLMGKSKAGVYYILAVVRGQWSSERVKAAIDITAAHYRSIYATLKLRLPQDPAQAGKDQAVQMRKDLAAHGAETKVVQGKKMTRARDFSEELNIGNVWLVDAQLPELLKLTGAALRTALEALNARELEQWKADGEHGPKPKGVDVELNVQRVGEKPLRMDLGFGRWQMEFKDVLRRFREDVQDQDDDDVDAGADSFNALVGPYVGRGA